MTDPSAAAPGAGPLAGIRVLDLTKALAGPYCTMLLADAGADVVKVEPPGGDDSRGWLPMVERHGRQESAYFMSANRGKRSVRLDLKTAEGVRRLRGLAARADVLVENFRPGTLEGLGLELSDLRRENPRLVTLSITGFGGTGPDGDRPGFDQVAQAEAGLMSLVGEPAGAPMRVALPISDLLAGMFGALGVSMALVDRAATGRGRAVDTSLIEAVVGIHAYYGAGWLTGGVTPRRSGNRHTSIAPYGNFQCADAELVIAVASESLWRRFAEVVGLDPDRPDIATNADRVASGSRLDAEIEALLAERSASEVLADLVARGIPAGQVRTLPEVYDWDQVRELGLVQHLLHDTMGAISLPGSPLRFDGSRLGAVLPPPVLGDHDAEVDVLWPLPNG